MSNPPAVPFNIHNLPPLPAPYHSNSPDAAVNTFEIGIGEYVDALAAQYLPPTQPVWHPAIISDISPAGDQIKVHFLHRPLESDEWIGVGDNRIAQLYTFTQYEAEKEKERQR